MARQRQVGHRAVRPADEVRPSSRQTPAFLCFGAQSINVNGSNDSLAREEEKELAQDDEPGRDVTCGEGCMEQASPSVSVLHSRSNVGWLFTFRATGELALHEDMRSYK